MYFIVINTPSTYLSIWENYTLISPGSATFFDDKKSEGLPYKEWLETTCSLAITSYFRTLVAPT